MAAISRPALTAATPSLHRVRWSSIRDSFGGRAGEPSIGRNPAKGGLDTPKTLARLLLETRRPPSLDRPDQPYCSTCSAATDRPRRRPDSLPSDGTEPSAHCRVGLDAVVFADAYETPAPDDTRSSGTGVE